MSDVAEEAMDSSAVSDEERQEASPDHHTSPNKSLSKISAVGEIIEGKRTKKTVERLDFQVPKQKEKLRIGDGSGEKLGDIPRTGYQITRMKPADLKPLHAILFDRPGKMATIKKNLRLFNGFPFDADSEQYSRKREKLLKNSHFTNSKLKVVCSVLDLEKKGTHSDLVDRILGFLVAPKNSGKRLPVKKKRKSKKKLSGDDSATKTKKKKNKPKPSSPKKTGSKSKAIVMDSSSDEDDDEDDEKVAPSAEAEGSDDKPSERDEEPSDKGEESADDEDGKGDDESPKAKASKKKSAPQKRQRTPAKKMAPPKKKAKRDASDESEPDSEEDETPKKKKSTPSRPAAKTKKADSSSNSKSANTADDSSDDDEPLIKMVKKAPSEEQLKETVRRLLEDANLEEMTMKQICQRVFDTYPDHDLSSKKDFIKQTVKSLIT